MLRHYLLLFHTRRVKWYIQTNNNKFNFGIVDCIWFIQNRVITSFNNVNFYPKLYVPFFWCLPKPKISLSMILTWHFLVWFLLSLNSRCLLPRSRSKPTDKKSVSLALVSSFYIEEAVCAWLIYFKCFPLPVVSL